MKKTSETNELTKSVIKYLRLFGWKVVFRNNNGGVYDPRKRVFRKKSQYDRNGVADIVALQPNGPSWWIEIKTGKDKMSAEQKAFKQDVEASGHVYVECRSLKKIINLLNQKNTFNPLEKI